MDIKIVVFLFTCIYAVAGQKGCYSGGKFYPDGASFMVDCNGCTCRNGIQICTLIDCPKKTCYYKGKKYSTGTEFKDDCNTCICKGFGEVECTKKQCGCYWNGKLYQNGARFKIECNWCTCMNGSPGCTKIGCRTRPCYHTIKGLRMGYNSGVSFMDDCNTCTCYDGAVSCTEMACNTY